MQAKLNILVIKVPCNLWNEQSSPNGYYMLYFLVWIIEIELLRIKLYKRHFPLYFHNYSVIHIKLFFYLEMGLVGTENCCRISKTSLIEIHKSTF